MMPIQKWSFEGSFKASVAVRRKDNLLNYWNVTLVRKSVRAKLCTEDRSDQSRNSNQDKAFALLGQAGLDPFPRTIWTPRLSCWIFRISVLWTSPALVDINQLPVWSCFNASGLSGSRWAVRKREFITFGIGIGPPCWLPETGHLAQSASGPKRTSVRSQFP